MREASRRSFLCRRRASRLIEPLLVTLKALGEQIKAADKRIEEIAGADEVVRRLCSVPGVGPVVATTFASTLDDASRFLGAKHVRSYLGLVPREYSSGERQRRGRATSTRKLAGSRPCGRARAAVKNFPSAQDYSFRRLNASRTLLRHKYRVCQESVGDERENEDEKSPFHSLNPGPRAVRASGDWRGDGFCGRSLWGARGLRP